MKCESVECMKLGVGSNRGYVWRECVYRECVYRERVFRVYVYIVYA